MKKTPWFKHLRGMEILFSLVIGVICHAEGSTSDLIRVACVGDSITFGMKIENREANSYPAQLQKLLGAEYDVRNFGQSGCTMMKNPAHKFTQSYWDQKVFQAALAFEPDVVVIKLGTNDLWKNENWALKDAFVADYQSMIDLFLSLKSTPDIFLCYPAPGFEDRPELPVNLAEARKLIRALAEKNHLTVIDTFTPLKDHPEHFPDGCHPNHEGAKVIAETVYAELKNDLQ